MPKITFTPKSKADLKAIGRYMQDRWGPNSEKNI